MSFTYLLYYTVGYRSRYNGLANFLTSRLSDRIEVIPVEDPGISGNFEVTVLDTGELLHSKKLKKQGTAWTRGSRMAILNHINDLLERPT